MKSASDRRNHAKTLAGAVAVPRVFAAAPRWMRPSADRHREKSAEVLVKVLSMGGMKQTITREELIALGKRFNVQPLQSALDLYP